MDSKTSDWAKRVGNGRFARIVIEYWLQEQRPQGWIDYAHKESSQEAFTRIDQLKTEKPGRTFRCVIRVSADQVISNDHPSN